MSEVRKAIIPAAGKGTRMKPVSQVLPKELLPIGTRPMIQFAVEEAIEGNVKEIAVVINERKELIRDYLKQLISDEPFDRVCFHFFYQKEAKGLADAIDQCREFIQGEPFALLLPDNVILSSDYRFSSMVELYRQTGRDVVGVIELAAEQSGLYGNAGRIDSESLKSGVLEIKRLYGKSKGTLRVAPGEKIRRTCGRYVCHPDLFDYIDLIRPQVREEFDEVPVYQEIIRQKGALGYLIPAPLFDTGNPRGYLAASAYLYEIRDCSG
ncbi:MAG: sugar phosphate nucleotidyltransferase [Acidobacteriota bacterium]